MKHKSVVMVESVKRTIRILQSIGNNNQTLTTISRNVNLSKATTYRLIKTLESTGFIIQDLTQQSYYLGPELIKLAENVFTTHQSIIIASSEEMQRLQQITRESVGLHIKIGAHRIVLEEFTGLQKLSYALGKGFVSPLHVGASAKVLLSEMGDNEREIYLKTMKLLNPMINKIIDKIELVNELETIWKQGYAFTSDEIYDGVSGISMAIKNYICPAALSIYGPETRFQDKLSNFVEELRLSTDRISAKLL